MGMNQRLNRPGKKKAWYLRGGIARANCVAAYAAKAAASLAASYVNLANPGTYNLTTTSAPSWANATGWSFNGTANYLNTGIVPNSKNWTYIAAFTDSAAAGRCLLGVYGTNLCVHLSASRSGPVRSN